LVGVSAYQLQRSGLIVSSIDDERPHINLNRYETKLANRPQRRHYRM